MNRLFILILCVLSSLYGMCVSPTMVVALYSGEVPLTNGYTQPEEMKKGGLYYTVSPRMDVYLPEGVTNAPMLLVIPGGSYRYASVVNEGERVAEYMVARGIAVAVLKYRMPNGHTLVPLMDAIQAMEQLRDSAEAWQIDAHAIGAMGFSAGGHLCSTLLTKYKTNKSRPDFGVLVYPVISMEPEWTHKRSHDLLLGEQATEIVEKEWSTYECVNANTPPCFLVACQDDKTVKVENSLLFYSALTRMGVEGELLILPHGGHGWGFSRSFADKEVFEHALLNFIQRHR